MKDDKLVCPICGEPTFVYMGNARKDRLCRKHGQMAKAGEIELCQDCGKWHEAGKPCDCKKTETVSKPRWIHSETTTNANNNTAKSSADELKCIICGEPSNGKHFCYACYNKYKDRSIDIRITNCRETEIIDEYGNLTYTCDDGRKVRSRAEAIICSWLYNNNIRIKYEEVVPYIDKKSGETKTLHPDFFLPDYNLYIEYNELTNPTYLKSKEYTQKIYESLGLNVMIMTDKELRDVAACLKPVLFSLKNKYLIS